MTGGAASEGRLVDVYLKRSSMCTVLLGIVCAKPLEMSRKSNISCLVHEKVSFLQNDPVCRLSLNRTKLNDL